MVNRVIVIGALIKSLIDVFMIFNKLNTNTN